MRDKKAKLKTAVERHNCHLNTYPLELLHGIIGELEPHSPLIMPGLFLIYILRRKYELKFNWKITVWPLTFDVKIVLKIIKTGVATDTRTSLLMYYNSFL